MDRVQWTVDNTKLAVDNIQLNDISIISFCRCCEMTMESRLGRGGEERRSRGRLPRKGSDGLPRKGSDAALYGFNR